MDGSMRGVCWNLEGKSDSKWEMQRQNSAANYASLRATIKEAVEIFFIRWQRNANQLDLL